MIVEKLWCLPSRCGLSPCLLSKHCWFRSVCASSLAVVSVQSWSSVGWVAPGPGLGGRLLVVELRLGGRVSARVDHRFLQEGRVGSRRDPSDGQVSYVVDFMIPLLRRGVGAFIAIVTGYLYLNPLSFLLLTILLHLTMSSVVLAARRVPAAERCRPCPP
ncbi:hypothetical protein BHE74_00030037 [Ensete ventricosum]|nr:hypothetical protein BHE74_00030037 [Ensete ventricosum]